ncbi:MAG: cation:proton antiporter [Planctomycetota bacterium]
MLGLALVLVLGVAAQWLAWRLHLPSILLLLLVGFLVGPVTGLLHPDELLGDALFPIVSLSVAIILLEGGLTLRIEDLHGVQRATRNLIVFGAPIAWGLTTIAATEVLGMDLGQALILGAILVVTGPTVIGPLLRHVRPSGSVGSIVQWEGIINDPIGAILALLVFHGMVEAEAGAAAVTVAIGALTSVIVGTLFGGLAAIVLIVVLRRFLVPDHLQSAVALALGLAAFTAADAVLHETGLVAVTLMGVILANQRLVVVEEILEFKENLRTLLISSLFILLSARIPVEQFEILMHAPSFLFVGALIFVIRPITVFLSTLGTGLSWREQVFLSWMAPRGIVAAAVASVFALRLADEGIGGGDQLVSVIFLVIVVTVTVYGLTASFVARRLGLAAASREGVLLLGAHDWSCAIAEALRAEGFEVLLMDSDREEVRKAQLAGLPALHGNVLSEEHQGDLGGLGRLLAITHSDSINSLAAVELGSLYGRSEIYQLAVNEDEPGISNALPRHLRGRTLFEKGLTFWDIHARFRAGAVVKRTPLTEEFDFEAFRGVYGPSAIPLFAAKEGRLRVFTTAADPDPEPGETLFHLSLEPAAAASEEGILPGPAGP